MRGMEVEELQRKLDMFLKQINGDEQIFETLNEEKSIYPFSREGRMLAYLLSVKKISYEQYLELNREYAERNKYLDLFEMAPRTFGETWGEKHILSLFPEFVKATKENVSTLYPNFDGEFDLWYDGLRIEVKACRANSTKRGGSLASRAYLHREAAANSFKYHYQQLKPSCCDVFIWIGVCRDDLIYWVLTSDELLQTGKLGSQHRNANTGVEGIAVYEGQVFMTEEELSPFQVEEKDILETVIRKGNKGMSQW